MTSISGTPGDGDAGGVGAFDPPAGFISRALIKDLSVRAPAAADPAAWWGAQARELLDWERHFTETLDSSRPPFHRWVADGSINASVNCLDRHVRAGRGDRIAFHWVGEAGETRDVTYADLHRDVQRFADALRAAGVLEGDVVGVYLPMIPEVVVAMLACARIGAIHDVVFGGFGAESVKDRLASSQARALVTVDGARRRGRTTPVKVAAGRGLGDVTTLHEPEAIADLQRTIVAAADGDGA
jgi:acetyl-CoA synthetase